MGTVLKGFDSKLHHPIAVKVLSGHWFHHPSARERFTREAKAAAATIWGEENGKGNPGPPDLETGHQQFTRRFFQTKVLQHITVEHYVVPAAFTTDKFCRAGPPQANSTTQVAGVRGSQTRIWRT